MWWLRQLGGFTQGRICTRHGADSNLRGVRSEAVLGNIDFASRSNFDPINRLSFGNAGQSWADFGRIWPIPGRLRPVSSGHFCRDFGEIWTNLTNPAGPHHGQGVRRNNS